MAKKEQLYTILVRATHEGFSEFKRVASEQGAILSDVTSKIGGYTSAMDRLTRAHVYLEKEIAAATRDLGGLNRGIEDQIAAGKALSGLHIPEIIAGITAKYGDAAVKAALAKGEFGAVASVLKDQSIAAEIAAVGLRAVSSAAENTTRALSSTASTSARYITDTGRLAVSLSAVAAGATGVQFAIASAAVEGKNSFAELIASAQQYGKAQADLAKTLGTQGIINATTGVGLSGADTYSTKYVTTGNAANSAGIGAAEEERIASRMDDVSAAFDEADAELNRYRASLGLIEAAQEKYTTGLAELQSAINRAGLETTEASSLLTAYAQKHDPVVAAIKADIAEHNKAVDAYQRAMGAVDGVTAAERRLQDALATLRGNADAAGVSVEQLAADEAKLTAVLSPANAEAQRQAAALNSLLSIYNPMASEINALRNAETALTTAIAKGGAGAHDYEVALANVRKRLNDVTAAAEKGNSALKSYQLVNFGQQIQDIGISLAGGQNPFLVMVQQVPQAASAVGGLSNMMTLLLSPTALAVAGLAAVAGTAALVAINVNSLSGQMKNLEADMRLGGNAIGMTVAQLNDMAVKAAETGTISVSSFRDMESAAARTGRIGGEALKEMMGLAEDWAAVSKSDDTTQAFSDLATIIAKPAEGAKTLYERFELLTYSQYKTAKALADAGDAAGAQAAILDALDDKIKGLAEQRLTALDRGLKEAGKAWSDFWDAAARGFVVDTSLDQQIAVVANAVAALDYLNESGKTFSSASWSQLDTINEALRMFGLSTTDVGTALAQLQKRLDELQFKKKGDEAKTAADSAAAATKKQADEILALIDNYDSVGASLTKAESAYAKFNSAATNDNLTETVKQEAALWAERAKNQAADLEYVKKSGLALEEYKRSLEQQAEAAAGAMDPADAEAYLAIVKSMIGAIGSLTTETERLAKAEAARADIALRDQKARHDSVMSFGQSALAINDLAEAYRSGDAAAVDYAKAMQQATQANPKDPGAIVDFILSQTTAQKRLNAAIEEYDADKAMEAAATMADALVGTAGDLLNATTAAEAWLDVQRGVIRAVDEGAATDAKREAAIAAHVTGLVEANAATLQEISILDAVSAEVLTTGLSYDTLRAKKEVQKTVTDTLAYADWLETKGKGDLAKKVRGLADEYAVLAEEQRQKTVSAGYDQDVKNIQASNIELQAQIGLVGMSGVAAAELAAYAKMQADYTKTGVKYTDEQAAALLSASVQAAKLTDELKKAQEYQQIWDDFVDEIKDSFKDAFRDVFSGAWDDAEDFFSNISNALSNLQADLTYNAVINVLTSYGTSGSSGGSTTVTASDSSSSVATSSLNDIGSTLQTASLISSMTGSSSGIGTTVATSLGLTETVALTDAVEGLTDVLGASTEMLTETGQFVADGLDGMTSLGGSIGSLIGGTASSLIWGWDSTEEQIGSTIGSTVGSFIGSAVLSSIPIVGTLLGSFLGDTIGGWIGSLFEDTDTPRMGFGIGSTESGLAYSGGAWAFDGVDQSEADSAMSSTIDALNSVISAIGGTFDATSGYWALGYNSDEYDGTSGYYYRDGNTQEDVGGYETYDEAFIGMMKDMITSGSLGEDLADEVYTVVANSLTTSAEDFANQLQLAANWDDLISTLETGTIDYTNSIKESADAVNEAYRAEIQSLQDIAAGGGLDVDTLNSAYETAILRYIGLMEDGEEAYTDAQYAYLEAVELISGAGVLLEQVGYSAEAASETIQDALDSLNATAIQDFYDDIDAAINSLSGQDYLNSFQDYIDAYEDDLAYAETLGADFAVVSDLWAATIESILSSSGDLGTAVSALSDAFPEFTAEIWSAYAAVVDTTELLSEAYAAIGDDLTATLLSFDAETEEGVAGYAGSDLVLYQAVRAAERAQEVYDYYAGLVEDEIDTYEDLIDSNQDLIDALYSLQDTAAALRLDESLSAGSLYDLLAEAQAQYEAALAQAYDTTLPQGDRIDAIDNVNDLVTTYLGYAQQYYASSADYVAIFNRTQEDLIGLSGNQIAELEAVNDNTQDQLDALYSIQDSIDAANDNATLSADELQSAITAAAADVTATVSSLAAAIASYTTSTWTPSYTSDATDYAGGTRYVDPVVSQRGDAIAAAGEAKKAESIGNTIAAVGEAKRIAALGYADGGVFGSLTNGVYSRPTPFYFADGAAFSRLGVMGEAGPEAVMPLSTGPDGSLGVRMFETPGFTNDPWPEGTAGFVDSRAVDELRSMRAEMAALREEVKRLRATSAEGSLEVAGAVREQTTITKDGVAAQQRAAAAPKQRRAA